MNWRLDKSRPICPQIYEQVCVQIAKGELKAGDRLFSVRELATEAGINPNTVQKSFELLEQHGLIYSVRCSGWYVSENTEKAVETVEKLAQEKTAAFFTEMEALGFDREKIKQYIEGWKQ